MTHRGDVVKETVLALDLEGTLISNALHQKPRPHLVEFLVFCHQAFRRVCIFSAVSPNKIPGILDLLAAEGHMPPALRARLEVIHWNGPHKDLRFIPGCRPKEVVLVDDQATYVMPGQEAQWVAVEPFISPYPDDDRALIRAAEVLKARLTG